MGFKAISQSAAENIRLCKQPGGTPGVNEQHGIVPVNITPTDYIEHAGRHLSSIDRIEDDALVSRHQFNRLEPSRSQCGRYIPGFGTTVEDSLSRQGITPEREPTLPIPRLGNRANKNPHGSRGAHSPRLPPQPERFKN